ncbi:hypothetical protein ACOI22_00515 [Glaciecola sp. 2405UD65-10]|uniref:hypothetical protein n=1 Tax=Glaciecola sp. 2405UD65-10 TaxID=3397244 RepID=UPI003B5AC8FB
MTKLNTRLKPRYFASIAASIAVIAACLLFWNWLYSQQLFAVGYVSEILTTPSQYRVLILNGLFEESGVALLSSSSAEVALGDWLMVYGTNYQADAQLLIADSFLHNPILSYLPQYSPQQWLTYVSEYKYMAILLAGVLILSSGTCFRYSYTLLVTLFLLVSLWHAGHAATVYGYIDTSGVEYYLLFGIVGLFGLLAYRTHDKFQISSRIVLGVLTFMYGSELANWLGFGQGDFDLLLFIVAVSFPTAITPLFAAYLLSKGFATKAVGDYMLLALAYALSFALLDRNTPQRLFKSFNKQSVKHKLKNSLTRQIHQFKKQFKPASTLQVKGKVTLAELMNKRSA